MRPILNLLVVFGCFVGIPIAAYYLGSWWMLTGIVTWGVGVNIARWKYRFLVIAGIAIAYLLFSNKAENTLLFRVISFDCLCLIIAFFISFLILRINNEYGDIQKLKMLKKKV
jgi:hypothetical protein